MIDRRKENPMKNLSRLQSIMEEIATNLRLADDWRTSNAYKLELLREAADACSDLSSAARALQCEIDTILEDKP